MIVFLDACVIYPAALRDVLLTLAEYGLYQIRWSPDVLEEMQRNLKKNGVTINNLREVMESAFPDAMVQNDEYSNEILNMPNHPKDRHVLAAAIACQADVLVTANMKDFRKLLKHCTVKIQRPNTFLMYQLDQHPNELIAGLEEMASQRRTPMNTVPGILNALHKTVPEFEMNAFDVWTEIQNNKA